MCMSVCLSMRVYMCLGVYICMCVRVCVCVLRSRCLVVHRLGMCIYGCMRVVECVGVDNRETD